jgi:hypothetical protein
VGLDIDGAITEARVVKQDLTSDQTKAIQHAIAGHKVDIRQLGPALDALAVVYGLSTRPTRH